MVTQRSTAQIVGVGDARGGRAAERKEVWESLHPIRPFRRNDSRPLVSSREHNPYEVMQVGWHGDRRGLAALLLALGWRRRGLAGPKLKATVAPGFFLPG